jgi:hypothetical protein
MARISYDDQTAAAYKPVARSRETARNSSAAPCRQHADQNQLA